ncbi:MAG: cytochrome c [Solirubrobacterales bacterium]
MAPLALLVSVALLAGCGGSSDSADSADSIDGKEIFQSGGCAGCHVLSAADAQGPLGPSLDGLNLSAASVARQVRQGGEQMPAFDERLSGAEIDAVSDFVAESSR